MFIYSLGLVPPTLLRPVTSIGAHQGYADTFVLSIVPVNSAGRFCMKLCTPSLLSL
jgi:hypothetical protein